MNNPGRPTMARLVVHGAREPWVLLASGLGGGVAWALGIPILVAVGVAALMWGAGAVTAALSGDYGPEALTRGKDLPQLRRGTEQSHLVGALDGYIADLRGLRSSKMAEGVSSQAIEALVAAENAHDGAVRAALAVDLLDDALSRSRAVSAQWSNRHNEVGSSVARMSERRDDVLNRLRHAVAEVAEVYTKLLELSATVSTSGVVGDSTNLDEVASSIDSLRGAFAELEAAETPELP